MDYALLVFDFSLAEENHFPYSEHACAVYQLLHHCSPLLTATALLTFSRLTLTCPALHRQTTNNKTERNKKIFLSLVSSTGSSAARAMELRTMIIMMKVSKNG